MQVLVEKPLVGNWRSFKVFRKSGNIHLNSKESFQEFDFSPERVLTIKICSGNKVEKVTETHQWSIVFKDKRHYLNIANPKLTYEVITINHTIMVLSDTFSQEKTFLQGKVYGRIT